MKLGGKYAGEGLKQEKEEKLRVDMVMIYCLYAKFSQRIKQNKTV